MNTFNKRILLGASLLLVTACAHYQQPVYNRYSGPYPAYGSGYVIQQRNYYADYPYRYNNNSYSAYGNYGYGHDDHHYDAHREDRHTRNRPWNSDFHNSVPSPSHRPHHDRRKNPPWVRDGRDHNHSDRHLRAANNMNPQKSKLYPDVQRLYARKQEPFNRNQQNAEQSRGQTGRKDQILWYR